MLEINFLSTLSAYLFGHEQQCNLKTQDVPLETLQPGELRQQKDGTLQFTYRRAAGVETRFFNSEAKLRRFLQHHTDATIWQIQDCRSNQVYFYYYAWGEYSRYSHPNDFYSDIASGTEAGVFAIKNLDNDQIHYYQQQSSWLSNQFVTVSKTDAVQLISAKQQSLLRQKQSLATLALAAAVAPSVSALSTACQSSYKLLPNSLRANSADVPIRYLANAITLSSLYCLHSKNGPVSPFQYSVLAGTLMTLPQYAVASSAVGNEFAINSYTSDSQMNPAAASLSDGGFVVTWQSHGGQDGANNGVFAKQFAANGSEVAVPTSGAGGAVGNEFRVNSYTTNAQEQPAVAALTDGGFVISWSSNGQDGSSWGVYGMRFAPDGSEVALPTSGTGGALGNEFRVNTYAAGSQNTVSAAALTDGGFIFTWSSYDQDGLGWSVYGMRFAANGAAVALPTSGSAGAIGNEFRVPSYTNAEGWQHASAVSSLPNGGFVVTWHSREQDEFSWSIYGKRFAANGAEVAIQTSGANSAVGNEFRANSLTESSQQGPAIASLPDSSFVIAWESSSSSQDISGTGVYGKWFAANSSEFLLPT